MRIGVFDSGWWKPACAAAGHDALVLPVPIVAGGNLHAADMPSRTQNGHAVRAALHEHSTDLLLDNGGAGLAFVPTGDDGQRLNLLHEETGKLLVSHFIDPITTCFQGLDWSIAWHCLHSTAWVKAVWDKAHAVELQKLGIPNVLHLPMAAPNRPYDVTPPDPGSVRPVVSFVGGQNTSYFLPQQAVAASSLLPGLIAQSAKNDDSSKTFHDVYCDTYGMDESILPADDPARRAAKTQKYFAAKLFYHAALCIKNRDRFVLFLHRKLGDRFQLMGKGWDRAYGIHAAPPIASTDDYFAHFRRCAVNVNLINGNAETGLNMRAFEITAAGGFMLCPHHPELADGFDVGKECVAFNGEADLLDKIEYYLAHPKERAQIAIAGQRRTLSQHLYSYRLRHLLQAITPATAPMEFSQTHWSDDLRRVVPSADVVLDCGANLGQMAKAFRNVYPDAEIYSFEPVRAVFDQLSRTAAAIHVHPVCQAVGDRDGKAVINLTTSNEANSLLDHQEGNPCARWTEIIGREEISICTLDRWCEENHVDPRRVDFIKLDVQGAELQALHGARKLLKTVKAVLAEVSFVPIYKNCPLFPDVDRFMVESGFVRRAVYPSDQPHNWADALYVNKNFLGDP